MTTPPSRARYIAQFTHHPRTPPLSILAVVGLTLSLLGISPIGALLSGFAVVDIRDGRRTGRPAALVGLYGGIAGCLVWAYAVAQVVNPGMLR
jgi:hypothetical protein